MDDTATFSFPIPDPGAVGSLAVILVLLWVYAAAMRSVFRLLLRPDGAARARCRLWARVASVVALAWAAFEPAIPVDHEIPILVIIAALDCWLALWTSPAPPAVPRATARAGRPATGRPANPL